MNVLAEAGLSTYAKIVGVKEHECKGEHITQALQRLDVLERTCLLLLIDGGFTVEDIADIVEKSEKEVEESLRDAREHVCRFYRLLITQDERGKELVPPLYTSEVNANVNTVSNSEHELSRENLWNTLYPLLLPRVRHWVYSSHLGAWYGQELDIIWDVVLAAVLRTFEFALKAEREGIVVVSLERLSITVARNYYLDLLRKDGRIIHDDLSSGEQAVISNKVDPIEAASEAAYEEWLFTDLAKEVARFPKKTRTALLIDLANRMDFNDAEPTPLQRAFLEVGICLKDYQGLIPDEPWATSRHASLLSVAYKRLARVMSLKQYDSVA